MEYNEFINTIIPKLKEIGSFKGKQDFLNQRLTRIGGGSGRVVYDIDGTKVIKLAKNSKGIAQNEEEWRLGRDYYLKSTVTEVFDGEDNGLWIISEKAKKVSERRIKELTDIPSLHLLGIYLSNTIARNNGRQTSHLDDNIKEDLDENEFAMELVDLAMNYSQSVGDMDRASTYGEVLRDGQPTIVLTDYGLSDEVYDAHYNRQRKQRMYELFNFADGNDDILSDIGNTGEIRQGMWAQVPYGVDDNKFINEEFIDFVVGRDRYPNQPTPAMPIMLEAFHECVNNIKGYLNHVDDKKKFYENLLKLQEYLISQGAYNRDELGEVVHGIRKDGINEDGESLYSFSNSIGRDGFPVFNPIDSSPSISNDLDANKANYSEDLEYNHVDDATKDRYVLDEGIELNIANDIAKKVVKKLGLNGQQFIGSGFFGAAYDVGGDKVLKITSDKSNAYETSQLIGKDLKYIAEPYNVFKIVSKSMDIPETYGIVLEKLKPVNASNIKNIMKKLDEYFKDYIGDGLANVILDYIVGYIDGGDKEIVDEVLTRGDDMSNYLESILKISREAKDYGVQSVDYLNPSNLGYTKEGNLGFFDVGFGNGFAQPNVSSVEINERVRHWVNGSESVVVKDKCRLGGLGNTSAACNQGDMGNLKLGKLDENFNTSSTFWAWVSPENQLIRVPKLNHRDFIMGKYKDAEFGWDYDRVFDAALKDGWVKVIYEKFPNEFRAKLSLNGYNKNRVISVFKNIFLESILYDNTSIYLEYEEPQGYNSFYTGNSEGKKKLSDFIGGLNEDVDASETYTDDGALKTLINGRRNVGLIATYHKPRVIKKLKRSRLNLIPVQQTNHDVDMNIVYSDAGKADAEKFYKYMMSKGGYVKDTTPDEAKYIGRLLGYTDASIWKYIEKKYPYMRQDSGQSLSMNPHARQEFDENVDNNEKHRIFAPMIDEAEILDINELPFKKEVESLGGKIFSVGGAVRDKFLGKDSKDLDILVTGIPFDNLAELLRKYSEVNPVGKSFGVIKFKPRGSDEDIDIAIPRTEMPTGEGGHKGFEVTSSHELPIEKDLERRDFTINAIAKDSEGNLIDPYGGQEDLKNKIIRVVNPQAFSDDPLRMLRGVQFASRFGFTIEPETMKLIQENAERIKEIPAERILIEFGKIVEKGNPAIGAQLLQNTGLYQYIFGGKPMKVNSDLFNKVKTIPEFVYLLTNVKGISPSDFYLKRFSTEDSKRDKSYKEIKALEMAFDTRIDNPVTALSVAHNMNSIAPETLNSDIIPESVGTAARELQDGVYPKTVDDLAVNGNDLMALGLKGKQVGDAKKSLLLKIYANKVKNNKEELLAALQNNKLDEEMSEPKVLYSAIVLDEESHDKLVKVFSPMIPEGWEIIAHHMTLNLGKINPEYEPELGSSVTLNVVDYAMDDKVMAVGVSGHDSFNKKPHITIAVNRQNGGKPMMSNLLQDWKKVPFNLTVSGVVEEVKAQQK